MAVNTFITFCFIASALPMATTQGEPVSSRLETMTTEPIASGLNLSAICRFRWGNRERTSVGSRVLRFYISKFRTDNARSQEISAPYPAGTARFRVNQRLRKGG